MNATSPSHVSLPHNILVALDAGSMSDHAIAQALDLAQRFDARLELVHAFGSPIVSWMFPKEAQFAAETAEFSQARKVVVDHVGSLFTPEHGGRARAEDLVRVIGGRPAQVILQRAREISADLIVLGALRRRPAIDFGSTARAVLAKSTCPIWVQPGPVRKTKRILVPVDLSEESMLALGTACEMALRYHARVTAVHAFEFNDLDVVPWDGYPMFIDREDLRKQSLDAFEKAMKEFEWKDVEHDVSFVDGHASEAILEQARDADLIVMGTHGRTGLDSVILGSVAYQVLKQTTRPVMVVRKPGRKFRS